MGTARTLCVSFALIVAAAMPALATPRLLTDGQLDGITAGQADGGNQTIGTQFNTGPIANQTVGTQQNVTNNVAVTREPLPSLTPGGGSGGAILGDRSTATLSTTGLIQLSDTVQRDVQAMNVVNAAESSVANGVNIWAARLAPQAAGGLVPLTLNTQVHVDQINGVAQDQSRSASLGDWTHFKTNVDTLDTTTASLKDNASVTKGNTSVDVLFGAVKYSSDKGQGAAAAGNAKLDVDTGHFSINPNVSITTKGSAVFGLISGEVTSQASMPIELDLPKLHLDVNAAACLADDGASCSASRDDSASSEKSSKIASAPTSKISNAQAEFILGDDSKLDVKSTNSVLLTGSVQQNVKAMNLVNAASSVVGNGVNLTANMGLSTVVGSVFNINQANLLIQRR